MFIVCYLKKLADVLMPQHFHGADLEPDPGQVLAQLPLVHDLDRHLKQTVVLISLYLPKLVLVQFKLINVPLSRSQHDKETI